jgi:hypothetical protein
LNTFGWAIDQQRGLAQRDRGRHEAAYRVKATKTNVPINTATDNIIRVRKNLAIQPNDRLTCLRHSCSPQVVDNKITTESEQY